MKDPASSPTAISGLPSELDPDTVKVPPLVVMEEATVSDPSEVPMITSPSASNLIFNFLAEEEISAAI